MCPHQLVGGLWVEEAVEVPEEQTHSFVIRFWLEETGEAAGQLVWRGQITHVVNGERRSLKELDDIVEFIFPYLTIPGDIGS